MNVTVNGNQVQFSGMPQKGVFASRGKVESIIKEIGDKYKTDRQLAMVVNGLKFFADPEFVKTTVDAYNAKNFEVVKKLWNYSEDKSKLVNYPIPELAGTVKDKSTYPEGMFAGEFFNYVWYQLDHADQK